MECDKKDKKTYMRDYMQKYRLEQKIKEDSKNIKCLIHILNINSTICERCNENLLNNPSNLIYWNFKNNCDVDGNFNNLESKLLYYLQTLPDYDIRKFLIYSDFLKFLALTSYK